MNKLTTIIIAGVVVIGGVAGLVLTNNKGDDSANKTKISTTKKTNSVFDAVNTSGLSFVATISSTVNGRSVNSTMESDAKSGAVRYKSDSDSGEMTMIYTKDAYYLCQGADNNCFKYNLGQGTGASFDPESYQYKDQKLADYRSKSVKLGTESCPAGTCQVWQITSSNYSSKVYIDTNTKRISQAVTSVSGVESKIVYDYKDVSVQIPTNVQTVPVPSIPTQ